MNSQNNEYRGTATYSPEDNKLRLYIGRVPREEYLKLKSEGWTTLHKQREAGGGDFAATWTPERRDTALAYAGCILDEDMGPEERAADRAERFSGYRDKRTDEATSHADRYDAGPIAHGYQSQERAERAAARHGRIADRAGDAWSKAEYWQRRTAGVIAHALYKSSPGVRMGRIKTLEAELRKRVSELEAYDRKYKTWVKIAAITDPDEQTKAALQYAGSVHHWSDYKHPRADVLAEKMKAAGIENAEHRAEHYRTSELSLYTLLSNEWEPITGAEACALFFSDHKESATETDWTQHLNLRLAYENQMLEAQGGRAAFVEMVPGGFLGGRQIHKVCKSPATGRVVSVFVKGPKVSGWTYKAANVPGTDYALYQIETERLPENAYRPPTAEELAKFEAERKAQKAAAPKKTTIPLINPTDADAERLQAIWNERAKAEHCASHLRRFGKDYANEFKPVTVTRIKQATYSAHSKGAYASAKTRMIYADGQRQRTGYNADNSTLGSIVCQIRTGPSGVDTYGLPSVIVLTDKPQNALPAAVWKKYTPAEIQETVNA